ncbi:HutD/Ves family protein [Bacteriovorax sp. BSW11_IV]|uniref:HutD/Ves family protein n=1 Tax=Bacteriovorax sp. BSW11_IV TaxID=1353529 RepID=UPI0006979A6D|nr:HutD family protein [Bacteriovorax sp. BSW11_IV]
MKKIIHSKDFISMPWKNGGGTTREIFRYPETGEWNFRISIAQVNQSGPFSIFNGFMRHLLLLTGKGMVLHSETGDYIMDTPLVPYTFSGEISIDAELISGPNTDFNVFWNQALYECSIEVIDNPIEKNIVLGASEFCYIYTVADDQCLCLNDIAQEIEIKANSIFIHLKTIS